MALRDTWHRALVYFGLAEEHDYPSTTSTSPRRSPHGAGATSRARRGARRPCAGSRERRRARDEIDDIFADDDRRAAAAAYPRCSPVGNGGADVQVHLVTPTSFNDAQEVADRFKRAIPVILNLQSDRRPSSPSA